MRIIVCGGRDFSDREWLYDVLDNVHRATPIDHLIEGGARGADRLAGEWASDRGVNWSEVRANWDLYGRRAGYLRNVAMADLKPDLVIAFPGGVGTGMMIRIARERGIRVQLHSEGG